MAESDMFLPFPNAIFRLARLLFAVRHAKIQMAIFETALPKGSFSKKYG